MLGKKIIIAGGGTGGHIFPALSIANALRKKEPDMDILFVGANGKMEMEKIPEAGYPIRGIDMAGYNRSSLLKNFALPYKLVKSFLQVKRIFKEFKPEAAIGVGGYSTFPVLRYAQSRGISTFIHESNSIAGKANRMLWEEGNPDFYCKRWYGKVFSIYKTHAYRKPCAYECCIQPGDERKRNCILWTRSFTYHRSCYRRQSWSPVHE